MTPIAPHITAFFQKRLAVDLRVSPHTSDTYAYAFQLLFEFMSRKLAVAPADLQLEQLDAPLVLEFLEHIQTDRRNSSRTRNARLAAIRSFMTGLLLKRTFAFDVKQCAKCGGRLVVRAVVTAPESTAKLLMSLARPRVPPRVA